MSDEARGLGAASTADRVEVRWPDGSLDVLENVAGNRFVEVRKGTGENPASPIAD